MSAVIGVSSAKRRPPAPGLVVVDDDSLASLGRHAGYAFTQSQADFGNPVRSVDRDPWPSVLVSVSKK